MIAFVYSLYNSIATFAFEKKSFGFEDLIFFFIPITNPWSLHACMRVLVDFCLWFLFLSFVKVNNNQ